MATTFGASLKKKFGHDPWESIFEIASEEMLADTKGLSPFWVYAPEGGAKIERHVPSLPLRKERAFMEDLRRSLAVYRMVFGQPRQQDLVNYILKHVREEQREDLKKSLRIDLSPRTAE